MTENNIAWHQILAMNRLPERTCGWWEACHINMAHNTKDPNANPYQPSGVAILSLNRSAHRVSSCRHDPGELGWLCWTTYRSRNNCILWVVAGYCPSSSNNRHLLVNQQHWRAFEGNKAWNKHPHTQFWNDLRLLLASWVESGNQILIAMDVNNDIQSPNMHSFFQSFGMSKAIAY